MHRVFIACFVLAGLAGCQKAPPAAEQTSAPTGKSASGWEIKYTATVALARRGSDLIKDRFDVLLDMLDEELQNDNCKAQLKDGRSVVNQQAATSNVVNALKAITELHRKRPELDLSALQPAIDKLSKSENPVLRNEADKTRIALGKS